MELNKLKAAIARLFHGHAWEASAVLRDGSVIEERCSCGEARHTPFVGSGVWIEGEHEAAKKWRSKVSFERVRWPC